MKDKLNYVTITKSAINYFNKLVEQENNKINLRLFVINPHTKKAEVNLTYCYFGEENKSDIIFKYKNFSLFVQKNSISALKNSVIDYKICNNIKKLSIKAPDIKKSISRNKDSLFKKLKKLFEYEINPNLETHGGNVELVDIMNENTILIKFNGGCQGCGMANVTLTQNIEVLIKNNFPEIKEIKDITNHELGINPYYY